MYKFGHVNPWWDDSFKNLDYRYAELKNKEEEQEWKDKGYDKIYLGGAQYNMSREMPDYAAPFFDMFDWVEIGINFFRFNTCEALPLHTDSYIGYKKRYNLPDSAKLWRCVVFLENWKSGHYFEIDGVAHLNWHRGDYVCWRDSVPHFAGNFGTEPRYTMQLTGIERL
jgi:hypothetical protein